MWRPLISSSRLSSALLSSCSRNPHPCPSWRPAAPALPPFVEQRVNPPLFHQRRALRTLGGWLGPSAAGFATAVRVVTLPVGVFGRGGLHGRGVSDHSTPQHATPRAHLIFGPRTCPHATRARRRPRASSGSAGGRALHGIEVEQPDAPTPPSPAARPSSRRSAA